MEANGSATKNLPQDILNALGKHEGVLLASYLEIRSGIRLLLQQGIPKEVISEVVMQAVEALSKDFNSLPYQNVLSRTETQPNPPNGKIVDSLINSATVEKSIVQTHPKTDNRPGLSNAVATTQKSRLLALLMIVPRIIDQHQLGRKRSCRAPGNRKLLRRPYVRSRWSSQSALQML